MSWANTCRVLHSPSKANRVLKLAVFTGHCSCSPSKSSCRAATVGIAAGARSFAMRPRNSICGSSPRC